MAKVVRENVTTASKRRTDRKNAINAHLRQLGLPEKTVPMNEPQVSAMIETLKPSEPAPAPKSVEVKKTAVQIAREERMARKRREQQQNVEEKAKREAAKAAAKPAPKRPMTKEEKIAEFEESIKSELDLTQPIDTATVSRNGQAATVIVGKPLGASEPDPAKARELALFGVSLSVGMFIGMAVAFSVLLNH